MCLRFIQIITYRYSVRVVPTIILVTSFRIQSSSLVTGSLQWPQIMVPASLSTLSIRNCVAWKKNQNGDCLVPKYVNICCQIKYMKGTYIIFHKTTHERLIYVLWTFIPYDHTKFMRPIIVRRAGLIWSQQDFEWWWSVPLSSASLY